jgi:hypothetical protein
MRPRGAVVGASVNAAVCSRKNMPAGIDYEVGNIAVGKVSARLLPEIGLSEYHSVENEAHHHALKEMSPSQPGIPRLK